MVIVAAVDPGDHASAVVDEALELAVAFDDPVHALHVMTESEANERRRATANQEGGPIDETGERELAAAAAEDGVDASPDEITFVGRVGNPSDEIIEYAREVNARYVVIGPRKRSPAGKALFGSVAQQVLLRSGVPVVAVVE